MKNDIAKIDIRGGVNPTTYLLSLYFELWSTQAFGNEPSDLIKAKRSNYICQTLSYKIEGYPIKNVNI